MQTATARPRFGVALTEGFLKAVQIKEGEDQCVRASRWPSYTCGPFSEVLNPVLSQRIDVIWSKKFAPNTGCFKLCDHLADGWAAVSHHPIHCL